MSSSTYWYSETNALLVRYHTRSLTYKYKESYKAEPNMPCLSYYANGNVNNAKKL
jgi:hypothetical protein